jgi:hypothetical protein
MRERQSRRKVVKILVLKRAHGSSWFNPGFTPSICYIKRGMNPGLNLGFGVLRCGLSRKNLYRIRHLYNCTKIIYVYTVYVLTMLYKLGLNFSLLIKSYSKLYLLFTKFCRGENCNLVF